MGQPAGTGQADHRPAGRAAATGWSGPALIYSIRDIDSANPDDREDFGALLIMDWQPQYAASVLAP